MTYESSKAQVAIGLWKVYYLERRACHCIGSINIGYWLVRLYRRGYIGGTRYKGTLWHRYICIRYF